MIEATNPTEHHGRNGGFPALLGLAFSVHDGEIAGFVGLDVAGNATTLGVISGDAVGNKGRVRNACQSGEVYCNEFQALLGPRGDR